MPPRSSIVLGSVAAAVALGLPATLTQVQDPAWRVGLSLAALVVVYLLGLFTAPPPSSGAGENGPKGPKP